MSSVPSHYVTVPPEPEEGLESYHSGVNSTTQLTTHPDGVPVSSPPSGLFSPTTKPVTWFRRPIVKAAVIIGTIVALFTLIGLLSKQPAITQVPHKSLNDDGTAPPSVHRVNPDGTETNLRQFTFKEAMENNPLTSNGATIEWLVKDGDDGYYLVQSANQLLALHVVRKDEKLVLLDNQHLPVDFSYVKQSLSPDWKYILLTTNYKSVWRHSFTAEYYVYNVEDRSLQPLTQRRGDRVQYAEWAPEGHRVFYVKDNNLYVTDLQQQITVTKDGSPTVLNGILDWVYEEEVYGDFTSAWWSPDGQCLTYLRLDDTPVPEFDIPMYHPENRSQVYTDMMRVRYPKPGYPNPLVSVFLFCPQFGDIKSAKGQSPRQVVLKETFQPDDIIITAVTWVTNGHDNLMVQAMNRVQDHSRLYLVDVETSEGTVVREMNQAKGAGGDGAWIERTNAIHYLAPATIPDVPEAAYIDVVPHQGYMHLALFSTLTTSKPSRFLTEGKWDVIPKSVKLDTARGLVYYTSTEQSTIQKHLYRVKLDGSDKTALTPPSSDQIQAKNIQARVNGTYATTFSEKATYYLLNYRGPDVPWFKLVSTEDPKYEVVLEDNQDLIKRRSEYALPSVHYTTVTVENHSFNVMEMRPPNFNPLDKHAVLFRPYGGPNSQMVTSEYSVDWHTALVSQTEEPSLKFIVVIADGRGTGYKGRDFMISVNENLGYYETIDQIAIAKHYQGLSYVDATRLAIWGWSYGGYLTSKVIEADSGVFKVGMAVAPVTHWNLYDSMYTERYMKTPKVNPKGYNVTGVNKMEGFKKAKFLLIHGTGDDNVHFQQSAALVNDFTVNSVTTYQVQYYVDSDHRNTKNNAYPQLHNRLKTFLFDNFRAV
ncbi:Dipeptidyl peptidase 4 [Dispira simplex]|nr:Dipeptidyl peptidase 4 [Dispira simplex]